MASSMGRNENGFSPKKIPIDQDPSLSGRHEICEESKTALLYMKGVNVSQAKIVPRAPKSKREQAKNIIEEDPRKHGHVDGVSLQYEHSRNSWSRRHMILHLILISQQPKGNVPFVELFRHLSPVIRGSPPELLIYSSTDFFFFFLFSLRHSTTVVFSFHKKLLLS